MSAWKRLLIATSVLLSGLLLTPFVALPSQAFSWQLFTGAYGSVPAIGANYAAGAPGSYFSFSGFNFPADQPVTVRVNGRPLGVIATADDGTLSFSIATAGAGEGTYEVTAAFLGEEGATEVSASTSILLDEDEPVREREGTAVVFFLPPGLASQSLFLPMLRR